MVSTITEAWLRERIAHRIPCATCNALVDPEKAANHFLTHAHYMEVHGWDDMALKWRHTFVERARRNRRGGGLPLAG